MKLTFLGGADEVGASATLIEMAGKKILVDAGIRISPKTSRGLQNDQLPHLAHLSDIGGPDAILITHAHTDHTGALAQVVRSYPRVPVYATGATIALSRVLLLDSSRLMENRFEAEGELPLYDEIDVQRLLDNWQAVNFKSALRLGADLQATFYPSGHIAGAAMIVLESPEGVLVMGGDDSVSEQRTVVKAQPPRIRADALVLESTYGGRQHANRAYEERRLIDTLKQVTDGGGKVLIPAFALGRAQEVIQILLAFRDELRVPVYVDGMVRSICDAYSQFSDILPKNTVKMAKGRPLFFRENVNPIRSRKQREEIIHTTSEPYIVVASSGMLTGGASVAYAGAFAKDERNGIFLTGYQDEESPGRFLQNVMRRKERGEVPALRLGDSRVPLRCHLGTYSLSAHADESELISIAEAVDAQRVFLVHGDGPARESMWEQFKMRGRFVSRPKVGQDKYVEKRRSLVVHRDGETSKLERPSAPVEPESLWKMLITHQGETFSARELAQVWYGDVEQAPYLTEILEEDDRYFIQHWRNRHEFTIKKRWQVERAMLSRTLMRRYADVAGQLVVMRNANGQPRLGVVESVSEDGFIAVMQGSTATNHDGDALVWPVGAWQGDSETNTKLQLNEMLQDVEMSIERVLPYSKRQLLAAKNTVVKPDELVEPLPEPLPEGEAGETAIYEHQVRVAAAALALARDGAKHEEDGLLVERALPSGPVNQQVAREAALGAFPPEARLRKVGMIPHKHTLILTFDFPEVAAQKYADSIEAIEMETGWEANPRMTTNQQALGTAVQDVLPPNARLIGTPSIYLNERAIGAEVEGVDEAQAREAETAYQDMTGYTLRVAVREAAPAAPVVQVDGPVATAGTPSPVSEMPDANEPLEINAAYQAIRFALEPHGLQKAGLKGDTIVLTFISPQLGARHEEAIAALAKKTGYPLRVYEHPVQNLILNEARALLRQAGLTVKKGPGIHTDRGEVSVRLTDTPDIEVMQGISHRLETRTGYKLVER